MTAVASSSFAPAPSLPRLVAIELRKTVDTRAGVWLLVASGLLAIVVVGLTLAFGHSTDLVFGVFFERKHPRSLLRSLSDLGRVRPEERR